MEKNNFEDGYPRPQFRRDSRSFFDLNGEWNFEITKSENMPEHFSEKITVPFSPESKLSGIGRTVFPDDFLWYERKFVLQGGFNRGRVILHIGAADQIACIYINGKKILKHTGGYLPFSAEITEFLKDGENSVAVSVRDLSDTSFHSRGKQKTKRGGIWYTPQSGIWQSVWIESVPKEYMEKLLITPVFDDNAVRFKVFTSSAGMCRIKLEGEIYEFSSDTEKTISLKSENFWSPENPYLYDIEVEFGEDRAESYFGMRKFSVGLDDKGVKRLFLNNKPYFQAGVLDQGYHGEGLYTPYSDGDIKRDIENAKALGFNMIRKHIKIEPLRFYYYCDKIGMLVWQDMVNGGEKYHFLTVSTPLVTKVHFKDSRYSLFGRKNAEGRAEFLREMEETIELLYNCPCISMWVLFNEGWGQFDAEKAYKRAKAIDGTRIIDHASGWHDQKTGDVQSLHVYFTKYKYKKDKENRPVVLSEFGGYNFSVSQKSGKNFGYKKITNEEKFKEAFQSLMENEMLPAKEQGLSAFVYTQLCDVEDELNGLVSENRKTVKIPFEFCRKLLSRFNLN